MEFYADSEKCNRCKICVEVCPIRIIEMRVGHSPEWIEGGGLICLNCGHCIAVCPKAAVSLTTMTSQQCPPVQKELFPSFEQMSHAFRSRRSIRAFKDEQPDKEMLVRLLTAANYSATGSNSQGVDWLILVGKDVSMLADLTAEYYRSLEGKGPKYMNQILGAWDSGIDTICRSAPAAVIAHGPGRNNRNYLLAMTQLSLLAPTLGMGTCWAGFVMGAAENWHAMHEFLNLPEGHACHGAIMIGYPKFEYLRLPLRNDTTILWR